MSELVKLCSADDISDGEPKRVLIDNFPPLAVYNVAGKFFVTDDTCTHGMASLTEGYQEGDQIECPFHGGAFDIKTGEPTAFPCSDPIKTYPVVEQDGDIYIRPDAT